MTLLFVMTFQRGLVTWIHTVFEERDARTNKQIKSKSGQKHSGLRFFLV